MGRLKAMRQARDSGMVTAEYAIGTVAACGFGGVLYKLLTNQSILRLLADVIGKALRVGLT